MANPISFAQDDSMPLKLELREDEKIDVKGITMGIIKEFNKGLLGESMDFLMMKRSELENLNRKPLYTTNDIRSSKNNILTIKPNDLWIKWKFVKSLLEAYGIE